MVCSLAEFKKPAGYDGLRVNGVFFCCFWLFVCCCCCCGVGANASFRLGSTCIRIFLNGDQAQFKQFSYILSYVLPLKLGLIQSLTSLCSLRPDFDRNADWLLEQCHRIWLAVEINGSWMIHRQQRKGFCYLFFIVLRSCGRKICLNMCHANSQNSNGCPYLFRICFIYGTNADRGVESLCRLLTANKMSWFTNKQVQVKILSIKSHNSPIMALVSILKLVSFERYASVRSLRKNLNRQLWRYFSSISAVQGNFHRHYYKSYWCG